jgi:hypothetical protein
LPMMLDCGLFCRGKLGFFRILSLAFAALPLPPHSVVGGQKFAAPFVF